MDQGNGDWLSRDLSDRCNAIGGLPYGDFFERLERQEGYHFVKRMEGSTHPIWVVEKEGKQYVAKFNWDHPYYVDGLKQERKFLSLSVDGVVKLVDEGEVTVETKGAWPEERIGIVYNIKELLPGPNMRDVDVITADMVAYAMETVDRLHGRGISCERDMQLADFVLDSERRPVIVDMEHARYFGFGLRARSNKITQRKELLSMLEEHTPGCTYEQSRIRLCDVKEISVDAAKVFAGFGVAIGGIALFSHGLSSSLFAESGSDFLSARSALSALETVAGLGLFAGGFYWLGEKI